MSYSKSAYKYVLFKIRILKHKHKHKCLSACPMPDDNSKDTMSSYSNTRAGINMKIFSMMYVISHFLIK